MVAHRDIGRNRCGGPPTVWLATIRNPDVLVSVAISFVETELIRASGGASARNRRANSSS
ncbi:hypothetical protein I546_4418 [Mycobacterium kansasii 732]|nr:hypothetical protein I546_4418 [Mycobacterium kansasii 732]